MRAVLVVVVIVVVSGCGGGGELALACLTVSAFSRRSPRFNRCASHSSTPNLAELCLH